MARTTPALLLLLLGSLRAPAAPAPGEVARDPRVTQALSLLTAWFDAEQAHRRLPGLSLAVVRDQELLYARGFGYAHLETKVPATPQTMYSICSISKLFTSVALMQQRDAGRLRLDEPVSKHLPWFSIGGMPVGAPPVTVFGLLTHSSGLPRESDVPYWTGPGYPFPPAEKIRGKVGEQEMLYRPETVFQYSNLGLTLAGEVAAAAAGKPWAGLVKGGILDPLRMKDTEVEHLDRWRGSRLATGYTAPRRDGTREKVPPYEVRGIAPAAGMTSTVEDLGRFASWQLRLLGSGKTELLDVDTLREMQRVQFMDPGWKTSWGLGFQVWRNGERTFVGHNGYCPGYQSQLLVQTDEKLATVFMTNTNGIDAQRYAQVAYDVVAPAVKKALDDPSGAKPHVAAFARYAGRYDNWLAGEANVFPWDDGLALLPTPSERPLDALVKLKPAGEHRFRRLRDDGSLGEEIRFEVDAQGRAIRLWRFSNSMERAAEPLPAR
ncbi:MAG: serine hydrolase domain-containing protein [Thermoanaerobaculia bacterium]|jgi:CubicO group peptidase (beta-lactamase class C family)|nr:serine hydrolase domain-containing protein [Thermoanaerobaculia bacterium]